MKILYFEVPNVDTLLNIYNQIQIIRYTGSLSTPNTPIGEPSSLSDWVLVTGISPYISPISLSSSSSYYYVYDDEADGNDTVWYASRYIDSSDPEDINSGWSDPILSSSQGMFYNPLYPSEMELTGSNKMVVDRIRTLIGDPVELKREAGEEYEVNIHPDGTVYELSEKGWPVSISMCGTQYNNTNNPRVNGYKYLKFNEDISQFTTVSGVDYNIDVWYYTFRHSDKEILNTYDITPPPFGLNSVNATSEAYILASAIDLVRSEVFLEASESGAEFSDNYTSYNPSPGLSTKNNLLEDLRKQLDKIVTSLKLKGISGVRVD